MPSIADMSETQVQARIALLQGRRHAGIEATAERAEKVRRIAGAMLHDIDERTQEARDARDSRGMSFAADDSPKRAPALVTPSEMHFLRYADRLEAINQQNIDDELIDLGFESPRLAAKARKTRRAAAPAESRASSEAVSATPATEKTPAEAQPENAAISEEPGIIVVSTMAEAYDVSAGKPVAPKTPDKSGSRPPNAPPGYRPFLGIDPDNMAEFDRDLGFALRCGELPDVYIAAQEVGRVCAREAKKRGMDKYSQLEAEWPFDSKMFATEALDADPRFARCPLELRLAMDDAYSWYGKDASAIAPTVMQELWGVCQGRFQVLSPPTRPVVTDDVGAPLVWLDDLERAAEKMDEKPEDIKDTS